MNSTPARRVAVRCRLQHRCSRRGSSRIGVAFDRRTLPQRPRTSCGRIGTSGSARPWRPNRSILATVLPLCPDVGAIHAAWHENRRAHHRRRALHGQQAWTVYVPVYLVVVETVLVASRSLPKGHLVTTATSWPRRET